MLHGVPTPTADYDTQEFWDAANRGELVIPQCSDCLLARWPPGPCCPRCQSFAVQWSPSTGRGTVYSWTVVAHAASESLRDQVPYTIVLVDLEEGIRIIGNLIRPAPSGVIANLPVRVVFETDDAGVSVPNFVPRIGSD